MHENRETSGMPAAKISRRTAGEGLGRTARMHIPEESDSGVVPMNHSNNDGQLSAESGEGRLLIKENVRQPDTPSTQSEIGGCLRERVERLPTRARYTNVRARSENEGSATAG